jgi:hypothetical protein
LHFFALLLPGNDDIAGILASVNDGAEVACGGVVEVAAPLLVRLDRAVTVLGTLRIAEPTSSFWMSSASSTMTLFEDSLSIVASTSSSSGSRRKSS